MTIWLRAILLGAITELVLAFLTFSWGIGGFPTATGMVGSLFHLVPGLLVSLVAAYLGAHEPLTTYIMVVSQAITWALLFRLWLSERKEPANAL